MTLRNLLIWAVIIVVLFGLYSVLNQGARSSQTQEIPYSQLLQKVDQGQVRSAVIYGDQVEASDGSKNVYVAVTPTNQDELVKRLEAKGLVRKQKGPAGKAFIYAPSVTSKSTLKPILNKFVRRIFGGSSVAMISSLFETKPPTADEIAQLEGMLEKLRRDSKTKDKR